MDASGLNMNFEFATSAQIVFGCGSSKTMAARVSVFGRRALLVTGKTPARAQFLADQLKDAGFALTVFPVQGEPEIETVEEGLILARRLKADCVIGCGGGGAIDTAKAVAAMLTNPGEPLDYLEVIGRGQPLTRDPAPCIAIPTTAGAGSEVTRNAVLKSREHGAKVSMRSPLMIPKLAVIDPELALGMPKSITAATGMDALSQLIEPFVSVKSNPMTDMFCREGIVRAAKALPRAFSEGDDIEARTGMAFAALLGGLSLANAGLGAVHGIAAPVGGMFDAPHGAVCAVLLPVVMEINLKALKRRAPQNPAIERYHEIARMLTGIQTASAEDGIRRVRELVKELEIPPLSRYGIQSSDLPVLAERASAASSTKGNPVRLDTAELQSILEAAL